MHDAPTPIARAVEAALLADALLDERDLPALLAAACGVVTRAAGHRWPAYAGELFTRACELMEIAAEQP